MSNQNNIILDEAGLEAAQLAIAAIWQDTGNSVGSYLPCGELAKTAITAYLATQGSAQREEVKEISSQQIMDALILKYDLAPIKAARLLTDFINRFIELNELDKSKPTNLPGGE